MVALHRAWLILALAVVASSTSVFNPFDDSIRYAMEWGSLEDSQATLNNYEPEPVYIRTKENEQYVCRVPANTEDDKKSGSEEEAASFSAASLLAPLLKSAKCLQDAQAYWTYEYCFGGKIRQFHVELMEGRKKMSAEYILGKEVPASASAGGSINDKATPKRLPKKRLGEQDFPYYSVSARGGTPCDLSGTARQAEVLFICLEDIVQPRLLSVKETQTCEYEVLVAAPQLCTNPAYRLPKEVVHGIKCSPVAASPTKPSALIEGKASMASAEFIHLGLSGDEKLIMLRAQQTNAQRQQAPAAEEPAETITFLGGDSSGATPAKPAGGSTAARPETPPSPDKGMIKQFLAGEFCLDGGSGWWKFEFCYGKHVLQYHREPNSRKRVEILLGKWNEQLHKQWVAQSSKRRKKKGQYHYTNGDTCDVTGKARSVTVKMRCKSGKFHPSQVAMSLQEPSTCNYILTVESPIFCELLESADENGHLNVPEA